MRTRTDRVADPAAERAHDRMNEAWRWLCRQRDAAPEGADIWDVRWQYRMQGEAFLTALVSQLLRGEYRLSPLQLHGRGENRKAVWGAQDALVLKWVALSLQHLLPLHPSCEHVKGHGGGKQSVSRLHDLLIRSDVEKKTADYPGPMETRHYGWVCRTDIRGYYRHIRKATLLAQVRRHVRSPVLCDLVEQYLYYTVEDGGMFHTPETGISRGCPLRSLMGALHLYDMDVWFSTQKHIHYARYMDDVIILAKSRWQLRRHTKRLKQWFREYGFEAHPDKTFTGRTEKGFDWMGAWLTDEGMTDIAPRAKANHHEKVRRLYERLARVPLWARKRERQRINVRVSAYRKRWAIWASCLALTCAAVPSTHATITTYPQPYLTPTNGPHRLAKLSGTPTTALPTDNRNVGVGAVSGGGAVHRQKCQGVNYEGLWDGDGNIVYLKNGYLGTRAIDQPVLSGWVKTDAYGAMTVSPNIIGQPFAPAWMEFHDRGPTSIPSSMSGEIWVVNCSPSSSRNHSASLVIHANELQQKVTLSWSNSSSELQGCGLTVNPSTIDLGTNKDPTGAKPTTTVTYSCTGGDPTSANKHTVDLTLQPGDGTPLNSDNTCAYLAGSDRKGVCVILGAGDKTPTCGLIQNRVKWDGKTAFYSKDLTTLTTSTTLTPITCGTAGEMTPGVYSSSAIITATLK